MTWCVGRFFYPDRLPRSLHSLATTRWVGRAMNTTGKASTTRGGRSLVYVDGKYQSVYYAKLVNFWHQ